MGYYVVDEQVRIVGWSPRRRCRVERDPWIPVSVYWEETPRDPISLYLKSDGDALVRLSVNYYTGALQRFVVTTLPQLSEGPLMDWSDVPHGSDLVPRLDVNMWPWRKTSEGRELVSLQHEIWLPEMHYCSLPGGMAVWLSSQSVSYRATVGATSCGITKSGDVAVIYIEGLRPLEGSKF